MGKVQYYKPKAMIDGIKIGQTPGELYVAIPDHYAGNPIIVDYYGAQLHIKDWKAEAVMFKRFRDKFWNENSNRSQHYTLGYFKFKPDEIEE